MATTHLQSPSAAVDAERILSGTNSGSLINLSRIALMLAAGMLS